VNLPGPLRWLSLFASLAVATAPGVMAVLSFADGNVVVGGAFLAVAVVAFAVPEYVLRRLPGPLDVLRRRLPFVRSEDGD